MKQCVICGKEFTTGKNRSNSATTCSLECTKENTRRWKRNYYKENKERILKQQKKYNKKSREQRQAYYHRNHDKIKVRMKKYYEKHKHEISKKARDKRLKLRLEVLIHYGFPPKCACCGETNIEFLTIDHIHGGGNKHRKHIAKGASSYDFYKWLKKNNFPKGFRVLCMNCNHSRGHYGYCPHDRPWQDTFELYIRELHREKGLSNSDTIELREAAKELLNI